MIDTDITHGTPLIRENRIILSLDGPMKYSLEVLEDVINEQEALGKELIWGVKLNSLLLHDGIHLIRLLKKQGIKVMADPKLFDISATMSNSAYILHHAGADIFTVHGMTGFSVDNKEVMSKMACVTILTSWSEDMCKQLFNRDLETMIRTMAQFAAAAGYGYLVCAPTDLEMLKDINIKKICPGVRPEWYGKEDDQKRTMAPYQARLEGAEYIVIGRPILGDKVPIDALLRLNEDMNYI